MLKYQRILLKLSGEALMGESQESVDPATVEFIIGQLKDILDLGVKVGVVIGGGNFFRGLAGSDRLGIQRANADFMGMLATAMNGILLRDAFNARGIPSKVYSAFPIGNMVKGYNRDSAIKRINDGDVVVFVGGVGSPFFTTDSGAALRAIEMDCDLLIKATKVDGVYDKDPKKFADAAKFDKLTFNDAITDNLGVMDMAAFALCRENSMNVNVCSIFKPGSLRNVVTGAAEGTLVYCN